MILPVGGASHVLQFIQTATVITFLTLNCTTLIHLGGWPMINEPLYRRPLVGRTAGKHPVNRLRARLFFK